MSDEPVTGSVLGITYVVHEPNLMTLRKAIAAFVGSLRAVWRRWVP